MAKYICRLWTTSPASILKRASLKAGKIPSLGLIDENIPVGKIEDAGPTELLRATPSSRPQLPADLESDGGLSGSGRHCQQKTMLSLQDCLNRAVDSDLLVVAFALVN